MEKSIKIGYSLSLSGGLASNGLTAKLAHQIWAEDVNSRGGLLGRKVELICIDDQTAPSLVAPIYKRLLDEEKVDLIIGGYGDNTIIPAMPLVIERNRYFVTLMGLAGNTKFDYENYFVMIPTGPEPGPALTEGFFDIAAQQDPRPKTMAILVADAPFSNSPAEGARLHAKHYGFNIVSEQKYPLTTEDFNPFLSVVEQTKADILFLCSYINDSIGLVKAINKMDYPPKLVGGAMIGPQNGMVKGTLGPLLNGFVNYEYWIPVSGMLYPGTENLMTIYQQRAASYGADPLGHYVAPQAYAQLQVLEQAIIATQSLDDHKLSQYTRTAEFDTVVGKFQFGKGGGWANPRVLQVQFQHIKEYGTEQFKGVGQQVVLNPSELASGALIYPYQKAKSYQ